MTKSANEQKTLRKHTGQVLLFVGLLVVVYVGIAAMWTLFIYMAGEEFRNSDLRNDYHPLSYWLYPASFVSGTIGFLAVLVLLSLERTERWIAAHWRTPPFIRCGVFTFVGLALSALLWWLLLMIVLRIFTE